MSVINKMLNDLNKRQQSHNIDNLPPSHLPPIETGKVPWNLVFIAITFMFIGALGMSGWIWWQQSQAASIDLQQDQVLAEQAQLLATKPALAIADAPLVVEEKPLATAKAVDPVAVEPVSAPVTAPVTTPVLAAKPVIKKMARQSDSQGYLKSDSNSTNQGKMAITEVRLTPKQLATQKIKKAQQLESQGLLDDATVLYSEALKYDATRHDARRRLAALYYGQGRFNDAIDTLEQGFALYPNQYQYLLLLARVQQATGNDFEALQSLNLISDTSKFARQKWVHQGDIAQKLAQYATAETAYRHLLEQEPNQANWWMALAYTVDLQGRYGEAKRIYSKALSTSGLSKQSIQYVRTRLAQLGAYQ